MPNPFWWLSYADDSGFKGAVIVRGTDFIGAVKNAHVFDLSPGGQVRGFKFPNDLEIPAWAVRKLLTKEECLVVNEEFERQAAFVEA